MFAHERAWGLSEIPVVTAVRIFSLGAGLLMLWATYRIARAVYPERPTVAVVAATIVAGWPQYVFMSRAISNDVMAASLSAAVLAILLSRGRPERYIAAAGVASLASLTKLTAAFTMAIVLASFALEYRLRPAQRKFLRPSGFVMLAVFATTALFVALEPIVRANLESSSRAFGGIAPAAVTFSYWVEVLRLTASSGWARFGWMNVPAPLWQAYLWWLLLLAGSAWALWNFRSEGRSLFVVALLLLWAGAVTAAYLRINVNRFQPQFRFAFALLPVLATLTAAGYASWFGRRPVLTLALLALLLFSVNLWLVLRLILPAYSV